MLTAKLQQYRDVQQRLLSCLQSDDEDQLRKLDRELSVLRSEILSAKATGTSDVRDKLHFLLDELCVISEDSRSARMLCDHIVSLVETRLENEPPKSAD